MRVIRIPNQRIKILSQLKHEFNCFPRNQDRINELRVELRKVEEKKLVSFEKGLGFKKVGPWKGKKK